MSLTKFKEGQDDRVWVALDGGVYDVTPFLDAHPGGAHRIMMVHGQDLAQFWDIYKLHDRKHIRALLEEYRIGNLRPNDYKIIQRETIFTNAYRTDPERPAAKEGRLVFQVNTLGTASQRIFLSSWIHSLLQTTFSLYATTTRYP